MHSGRTRLLACLNQEPTTGMPIWLMRQAGRYLPEYRALRAELSFLELVKSPSHCTEAALQPLRRYDLDATIVFSDILVIHQAIGAGLSFVAGDGPRIEQPVRNRESAARLDWEKIEDRLGFVYEAVQQLRTAAPEHALFGFAGSPWTLLCYLVEGEGSSDFAKTRTLIHQDPTLATELLSKLAQAVAVHLRQQYRAGADVVQIFDTWGGLLSAADWERFAAPALKQVAEVLKDVPTVLFVRGSSHLLHAMKKLPFTAFSVDHTVDLTEARNVLQKPTQGNLDNTRLLGGETAIAEGVERVLSAVGEDHIFNLGHGVLPSTPPEAVSFLVNYLRSKS